MGFGELGTCLVKLLRDHDVPTHIWRRPRAAGEDQARRRARALGAQLHEDLAAAVSPADLILSCVPGAAALTVATEVAAHVRPESLFVDAASAGPEDKQQAADRLTDAGADYVDAAVIGSVAALGAQAPWLVAGPGADRFELWASALAMRVTVVRAPVGAAARIKMLRSVYLKGRDALVTEMAVAAHAHGVLQEVVRSIGGPAEQVEFPALVQRILRSTAQHSDRRADELEAAARVVRAAGVMPMAAEGALRRLRALTGADLGHEADRAITDLVAIADEIESAISGRR